MSAFSWIAPPRYVWSDVRVSIVSARFRSRRLGMSGPMFVAASSPLASDTVRPAVPKTVAMTVVVLTSPSTDFLTMPASLAYNTPHSLQACRWLLVSAHPILLEVNQISYDAFALTETCQNDVYRSGEEHVGLYRRKHSALSQPCVMPNHSECPPSSVRTRARITYGTGG